MENSGFTEENLLPTRLGSQRKLPRYKLPLFLKWAWLTLLSRVRQTSHFETENPEFPSFQG